MSHRHAHHSGWHHEDRDEGRSEHRGWHPDWHDDRDDGRSWDHDGGWHRDGGWRHDGQGDDPSSYGGQGSWRGGCEPEHGCHGGRDGQPEDHAGAPQAGWGGFGEGHHYDAVLFGHLAGAEGPGAPMVVIPIEHLEVNNNTLIQNTSLANTNVLVNAGDGGHVNIGGSVSALGTSQSIILDHAVTGHQGGGDLLHELGLDRAGDFDQLFGSAHGGFGHGAGGPIVIVPIDHLTINNNTLIQNTQVENTNVVLDAHGGGSIHVAGDVTAQSDQHSYIEHG